MINKSILDIIKKGDIMEKVLITGARSGIGAAVIDKLKDDDYYIYLTVHTEAQLDIVKEKYKDYSNIECFKLDITNSEDLKKLEKLDIDILINNAATNEGGSVLEMPMNKVRTNFEVNLFSFFEVVQIVARKMLQKNNGKIILMASLAGLMPFKFTGAYAATKVGIIKIADTMRKELKLINSNVKIILVEPGMYYTGFNQVMFTNKYDWMEKESYFKEELEMIRKQEKLLTTILEKKRLCSIVRKIVRAVKCSDPKFIYRAPLSQVILTKIYSLIWE